MANKKYIVEVETVITRSYVVEIDENATNICDSLMEALDVCGLDPVDEEESDEWNIIGWDELEEEI